MHHNDLLGRGQLGLQAVRWVRAVPKGLSLFPRVDRLLGNALAAGQDAKRFVCWQRSRRARQCGAGVLVQRDHHEDRLPVNCYDFINSLSTAQAMNSG